MAGNTENQYGSSNTETKPEGAWGATPKMHSWCLQPDRPISTSEGQDGQRGTDSCDSKSRKSALVNDADDDSGLELNLGLSLGGSKSCKPKGKERVKETLLDRDVFQDKDSFRDAHGELDGERRDAANSREVSPEEPFLDGVTIQSLKMEQKGGGRVQAFWHEFARSAAPDGKEKGVSASHSSRPVPPPQQAAVVEAPWRQAENSVAEDPKMFARHISQALQEKAAQPEHQPVPFSVQDEASLIKELQNLPPQAMATAAAWARYIAQGNIPMQLLEAFKDGVDPLTRGVVLQSSLSINSLSSSQQCEGPSARAPVVPHQATAPPSTDLERSDSDVSKNMQMSDQQHRQAALIQQQELVEQQRKRELQTQKRQEARRKRKALLEGQKQSKKAKKEDERPGSTGPPGASNGKARSDMPPNQLRRTSSLQPPSPPPAKESSISTVSSPPDSQDAGGASSITAFRRPGSSSWPHNWEANPQSAGPAPSSDWKAEKKSATVGGDQIEGEQLLEIRRALQRERDRATKDRGRDGESGAPADSGGESRRVSPPDMAHLQKMKNDGGAGGRQSANRQEGSGSAPPVTTNMDFSRHLDPVWIQRMFEMQMNSFQIAAMMESDRENTMKRLTGFNQMRKGADSAADRPPPRAEAEKVAEGARASSQTSSGGSENSDRKDEKSNSTRGEHRDGETLSSRPASSGGVEGGTRPISIANPLSNPFPPPTSGAVAIGSLAYPPNGSFPLMPFNPFPIPVPPGATAGGVPFNVPFPFPYLMQFTPAPSTGGDGNPDQRPHPSMHNPFQIALPPGYPPFQIQTPEGPAAWASAVVRPHPTPPHSPPRSNPLKRSQSGMAHEEDNRSSQGGKGNEHVKSRNASPSRELPTATVHPLSRAGSMGSGAFNRLRPIATQSTPAPQSGLSRSKSDAAALRREGSIGSAFATLGESSQGGGNNAQGNPSVVNVSKGLSSLGGGSMSRPERSGSRMGAVAADDAMPSGSARPGTSGDSGQSDVTAAQSTSSAHEEMKRLHHTGVCRQGSLPSIEGLAGQEASSLRPGIAAGQHFGGTGSPPDLPWVTCNGMGPNGKTISGVLYKVDKGQVRIVCACHGRHMTPAEFVQHAGCGEMSNPEKAIVVGPFAIVTQQPASAQA